MGGMFTPRKIGRCPTSGMFPSGSGLLNAHHFLAACPGHFTHFPTTTTFHSFCFSEAGFPGEALPNSLPSGAYLRSFSSYFSNYNGGLISLTMILSLSGKRCKAGGSDLRFQARRRFTKELFTCPPHLGEEPVGEAITFPSHASFTPHFQTLAVQQMRWL